MRKTAFLFLFLGSSIFCAAQFAPPAGQAGTTAMYKDSSAFVEWANACTIHRGYQNIANPSLGYASAGDSSMALGVAGANGVVSLGDSGYATLSFLNPITNGPGNDFAVFENGFSDTFLELGFVEVSSDGVNFFRFPATSNTQDTTQIGSFGAIDATHINNLAGKYRALYGTPFDLQELASQQGLDVNRITQVRIVDVIGCIQEMYATYDQNNHKVNDPWNTAFASGGFDLDAVGVVNQYVEGIESFTGISQLNVFPNPVSGNGTITYELKESSQLTITLTDVTGQTTAILSDATQQAGEQSVTLNTLSLANGIYFIRISGDKGCSTQKIIVQHE